MVRQWFSSEDLRTDFLKELTAAGTVHESHMIPFSFHPEHTGSETFLTSNIQII
jgi:hypothetical protein